VAYLTEVNSRTTNTMQPIVRRMSVSGAAPRRSAVCWFKPPAKPPCCVK